MKNMLAFIVITLAEVIACAMIALLIAVLYGCTLSEIVTTTGAVLLLSICAGFSIIAVAAARIHLSNCALLKRRRTA